MGLSRSDFKDDFASRRRADTFQHQMSFSCILKRENRTHSGAQSTAIDQACDLRQVSRRDVYEEEGRVNREPRGEFLIRLQHSRDKLAAALQDLKRSFLGLPANKI
jgi:hypothetical protein